MGARPSWVDPLARAGLAARAVLYFVLAGLVAGLATGRTRDQADERGAFMSLAAHPFGRVLVVAVALGMAGMAIWQGEIAIRSEPEVRRRLVAGGKAIAYAAVTWVAVTVAAGDNSDRSEQDATVAIMRHLAGRIAFVAVGAAFVVGGIVLAVKGCRGQYDVDVHPPRADDHLRRAFAAIGVAGMVARGLVFGMVGVSLIAGAVQFDPTKARGLDTALRSLAGAPYGPWLIAVVAAGLGAFGTFSALEVRYARA